MILTLARSSECHSGRSSTIAVGSFANISRVPLTIIALPGASMNLPIPALHFSQCAANYKASAAIRWTRGLEPVEDWTQALAA